MIDQQRIRNFCIIAHIDHGKSTLADRILQATGLVDDRLMKEQYLDRLDLERERGITIKAQSVRIPYKAKDGRDYVLNLIDTPGHVDFSYEVSRSLVACEGALLVVDASQGVEAQSLANAYLALENNLEIIPVLNKIDLPSAEPERIKAEIEEIIGLDCKDALLISAKTGQGVPEVLERIITDLPPPMGDTKAPLKALIFDSWYDTYLGVVVLFRVVDGRIKLGQDILLHSTKARFEVTKLGVFSPDPIALNELGPGEVGFLCAGIKILTDARVGDTITDPDNPTLSPAPGFKKITAMVFCGMYPVEPNEYGTLKHSLEKLQLNDAAFTFEPETSHALGFGFRCGFLGLLHMEIIQERLEREFQARLLVTAPSVIYQVRTLEGETLPVDNPSKLPPLNKIEHIAEPYVHMEVHVPNEYLGAVLALCEECRGTQKDLRFLSSTRVIVTYELPFAEIVYDFFDRLKSVTRGYASLDYEFIDFRPSELVKLDILINSETVDALSIIVHKDKAYAQGRELASRLRSVIPRQLFEVVIQAAIGQRIIAKERVAPMRKNVTAKCYGGDITRKRKLLEKQKEGKRRMKRMGNIDIPQEAFLAVLRKD
ncbi:GTP-binding protein LepA [Desulfonatronum thiosulfatophilum]|uniref:Elongation factor 4 n=1 Tax=Desulfonatronum thiosulfatophilum TaxID=617002 RepID=A0A1G6AXV2_9BACT|nr:translation elongation factor 4 [Desulfonatronum thiosulfatophilum]SDB13241.1 GTP-binding protein LepA [Desulfonatronum thiosulfatophilum]